MKKTLTELAKELILSNEVQSLSVSDVSRKLMEKYPSRFLTIKSAKTAVKYVYYGRKDRGMPGIYDSVVAKFKTKVATKVAAKKSKKEDFSSDLPEEKSYLSYNKFYKIENSKRMLILGDIHCPFYNKQAFLAAVKYGVNHNVDSVLINGDLIDFFNISTFVKDDDIVSVSEELQSVRKLFKYLRDTFGPTVKIYYKLGNHEERFQRYLSTHAPELLGVEMFSLEKVLDLAQYNIILIDSKQIIKYGKSLNVIHGHEFRTSFGNPVNPARTLFTKTKGCTICGHFHQISKHTEKNIEGSQIACWSHGCLCNVETKYAILNNWSHGFVYVELYDDGTFHVENCEIINGKIV